MNLQKAIYWASAAMLVWSTYRIGSELSEVWGNLP